MEYNWNEEELATNQQREYVLKILKSGLESVLVEPAIDRKVKRDDDILKIKDKSLNLSEFENVYILGAGKASARMAKVIEDKTENIIEGGVVISKENEDLEHIESLEGDHPIPSQRNLEATERVVSLAKRAGKEDLVINLISGGGSALLTLPRIPLEEFKKITETLIEAGENINHLNTVRKHLSRVKGGYLLKKIHPARSVSLLISDVAGDNLSTIASGPTVRDPTTVEDAEEVLEENGIDPHGVGKTPKEGKYFDKADNILLLSGSTCIDAMKEKAEDLGLEVGVYSREMEGEARKEAHKFLEHAKNMEGDKTLLAAGETTVTVTGDGKGGRNQEFVLAGLKKLANMEKAAIGSLATDGEDFIPVAGAVADQDSLEEAQEKGLDPEKYLENNDSYHFFEELGNSIIDTGRTGTNVADIVCLVKVEQA